MKMNKKKLSFIFFIVCILTVFVSLSLTKAAAETSATTSNSKTVDTMAEIKGKISEGCPLCQ